MVKKRQNSDGGVLSRDFLSFLVEYFEYSFSPDAKEAYDEEQLLQVQFSAEIFALFFPFFLL
jgi:hypothetical protein